MTSTSYPDAMGRFEGLARRQQSFADLCETVIKRYSEQEREFQRTQLDRALRELKKNAEGYSNQDGREWLARYLNNVPIGKIYRDMQYNTVFNEIIHNWESESTVNPVVKSCYIDMLKQVTRPQYAILFIAQQNMAGLYKRQHAGEDLATAELLAMKQFGKFDILSITMKSPAYAFSRLESGANELLASDMQSPFVSLRETTEQFLKSMLQPQNLQALNARADMQKEPV